MNTILLQNKLRELKYRILYPLKNEKMKEAYKRYRECTEKKEISIIRKEIKLCKDYWGCYPFHYIRNNLYRNDKVLSESELLKYIPEFYFYKLFLNRYDSLENDAVLTNKIKLTKLFDKYQINQPKTNFYIKNGELFNENLNNISIKIMLNDIYKDKPNKIFFKPSDGEGGFGIYIFNIKDNKYINKDGKVLDEDFINYIKLKNNYVIQYGIDQRDDMKSIYSKSVNTFRIATENIEGNVRVICATLRMGKNDNEVDNSAQDGIVVGIDIETGKIFTDGYTERGVKYLYHPDTNFKFKNYCIEGWNDILDFAIKSAKKLENYSYLGWDICVEKDRILAIETNLGFGIDHYQVVIGGLADKFNINNTQKYWNGDK